MKLRSIFAVLTAVTLGGASGSALAQPAGGPPMPKPAAGALPQTPAPHQRTGRVQTPDEQQLPTAAGAEPVQSTRPKK